MKKLLSMLLMLLLLLALPSCAQSDPDLLPKLTVTFLNVGAADCIVLQTDGHAAMIDTGNHGDAEDILDFLSAQGIQSLDFLLLTHLDKDHIGGADILMERIPIGTVYAPDYDKGNKQYEQYIAALETLNIQPIHPTAPVQLTLGAGTLTLLPGEKAEYDQSNDYSIIAELIYGSTSFLFAGDAEAERLTEYLVDTPLPAVNVLKVPHHGRKNSMSNEFFTAVCPKNAIITCDEKEMPDDSVIEMLSSLDAEVYGTVYGAVTVASDGTSITVRQ